MCVVLFFDFWFFQQTNPENGTVRQSNIQNNNTSSSNNVVTSQHQTNQGLLASVTSGSNASNALDSHTIFTSITNNNLTTTSTTINNSITNSVSPTNSIVSKVTKCTATACIIRLCIHVNRVFPFKSVTDNISVGQSQAAAARAEFVSKYWFNVDAQDDRSGSSESCDRSR